MASAEKFCFELPSASKWLPILVSCFSDRTCQAVRLSVKACSLLENGNPKAVLSIYITRLREYMAYHIMAIPSRGRYQTSQNNGQHCWTTMFFVQHESAMANPDSVCRIGASSNNTLAARHEIPVMFATVSDYLKFEVPHSNLRINTKASFYHGPASEATNEWQFEPDNRVLKAEYQTQDSSLCLVHRLLADKHPGVHNRLSGLDCGLQSRQQIWWLSMPCRYYEKLCTTFVFFFSTSIPIFFSLSVIVCSL